MSIYFFVGLFVYVAIAIAFHKRNHRLGYASEVRKEDEGCDKAAEFIMSAAWLFVLCAFMVEMYQKRKNLPLM